MTADSTANAVGPFSLDDLMAWTKPPRNWVLSLFLSSVGADDLAAKLATEAINPEITFEDLIAVGALKQGQRISVSREGVRDAVVEATGVRFRGAAFSSPVKLSGYMGRRSNAGRPVKYNRPTLYVVNDVGPPTPLAVLMNGSARKHAQRRTERQRICLILQAIHKPIHRCTKCGNAEREINRSLQPHSSTDG